MQVVKRVATVRPGKTLAALALMFLLAACSNYGADGLKHKAIADEVEASKLVGGFTDEGRALYHRGLQHIANAHQPVGQFTIRQVIEQEMTREKQRSDAQQKATDARESAKKAASDAQQKATDARESAKKATSDAQQKAADARESAKKAASDARLDALATANLQSSQRMANTLYKAHVFYGGVIKGDSCFVKMDGDFYENDSEQDKAIMRQTFADWCQSSYTLLGGKDTRTIPPGGIDIWLADLAGRTIYRDRDLPQ
jgi:hypothetical protein